ncbi:MAG: alpha/beta hydrolase [Rhodobacteraceae bacterium]|nr:MAG: alpha/beta hydrolase [Paracoccaceae bacterium]
MQHFTTSDGLSLAYDDTGQGTPILCLSGLTRNSSDFQYVLPHLKNHRVIRMDMRGRGQSDFDPDYANYNVLREGQDALELMDHLGIDRFAILGTSRGGIIAMTLAPLHHDRLLGVMLNDIGPAFDPRGIEAIMNFIGRRPSAKTYTEMTALMPEISVGFNNVPTARWDTETRTRWIDKPDGLHLRYDPALRQALEEQSHGDTLDLWACFDAFKDIPLALVRGENSNLLTMETVSEMQNRMPQMHFSNVKDRAHIPFLDEPEALDILAAFLKDIA